MSIRSKEARSGADRLVAYTRASWREFRADRPERFTRVQWFAAKATLLTLVLTALTIALTVIYAVSQSSVIAAAVWVFVGATVVTGAMGVIANLRKMREDRQAQRVVEALGRRGDESRNA